MRSEPEESRWVAPMLATAGPVPTGDPWAFEVKFDGIRAIVTAGADGLRLRSRYDHDLTVAFPELAGVDLGERLLLDGEVVALDERGRSDFELLQQRSGRRPDPEVAARVPVTLVVFDLLRHDGEELLAVPYTERRAALEELRLDEHRHVQVSPRFDGVTGDQMLELATAQGLEGVVAKRVDSRYEPGRRSKAWIKTAVRHRTMVTVVGWAARSGGRDGFSALLLAVPGPEGRLVYAGDVGTGFDAGARSQLQALLAAREIDEPAVVFPHGRSHRWRPQADLDVVRWARPGLIGEIAYREITRETGSFRHPSWLRLLAGLGIDDLEPPDPGR